MYMYMYMYMCMRYTNVCTYNVHVYNVCLLYIVYYVQLRISIILECMEHVHVYVYTLYM